MAHKPRCKCVECDKTFDVNRVRVVDNGLMRLFLAVRLSKRIDCNDCICQKCRSYFRVWMRVRVNGATMMLTFHLRKQDLQMISVQFKINQNKVNSILLPKQ